MMKTIRYITILTILIAAVSCSKWLDVYPKSEISSGKVFENEDGYYAVLSGLYLKMSDDKLYGFDLACGYTELMGGTIAQGWGVNMYTMFFNYLNIMGATFPNDFKSMSFSMFQYVRNGTVRLQSVDGVVKYWWSGMYNIIANSNMLINELEKSDAGMFEGGVKELLLGEALAIRAYCHLDLVRIFQPPYLSEKGKTERRIPYMDQLDGLKFVPSSTTDAILDKVDADLARAAQMMASKDPISSSKRYRTKMFTTDRRYKMNYYAVKLLQARSLLYRQKDAEAYQASMEVINAMGTSGIRFATEADMVAKDGTGVALMRSCPMEILFGVTTEKLSQNYKDILSMNQSINVRFGAAAGRAVSNKWLTADVIAPPQPPAFFTSANDLRLKFWVSSRVVKKYIRESNTLADAAKYPKQAVTLLKIGEAYLIAAEAALTAVSPAEAKRLLNELQVARGGGVSDNSDVDGLKEELLKEFRRETLGDGQLFFFNKRRFELKFQTLYTVQTGTYYNDMTADEYTPSVPDDEYDNGRTY